MGKITNCHPDYTKALCEWKMTRDAAEGNYKEYIIPPEYNAYKRKIITARNLNYIERAVYTNFTAGTVEALVGLATQKDPTIEVPSELEYLISDCTPDHLTFKQLHRKSIGETIITARYIFLTDFPAVALGQSAEYINRFKPLPKICTYRAEDLINWDVDYYTGQIKFLVLREKVRMRNNDYEWNECYQYKRAELDEAGYYNLTIRDQDDNILFGPYYPTANGKKWDYIPVDIIGSEDNNLDIDKSLLSRIAHVNFGHLRNSASYEDNLDAHGQGTLLISTDMPWSKWKEKTETHPLMMGSREGHYIGGPGSKGELLQLAANQEIANAMKEKIENMLAMGAHIITANSMNAPVETTQLNMGSKASPLVNYQNNVEAALRNQLYNCGLFLGLNITKNDIIIDLPKDLVPKSADPILMQALLAQNMGGIIPKSILRNYDRMIGLISDEITDEELDNEVNSESPLVDLTAPSDNNQEYANNNTKGG